MKKFHLEERKIKYFFIIIFIFLFLSALSLYFYKYNNNLNNNNFVVSYDYVPLLAVSLDNNGNVSSGSVAFLELNIINGSGRVFVNSEPFSKVDTQASTVFANKFACDFLDFDCSKYDFLYSIKSESPIVGGPSASAAVSFLTISMLSGFKTPKNIAITGTINSGGIIGNVGGVKEKILAAENYGLKAVFVPSFTNESYDDFDIKVFKVSNIKDVFKILDYNVSFEKYNNIFVPSQYYSLMEKTSDDLCNDNFYKIERLKKINLNFFDNNTKKIFEDTFKTIDDLNEKADFYKSKKMFYSRASFCFNVRTKLYYLDFLNSTYNFSYSEKKDFYKNVLLKEKNINDVSFKIFKNNKKYDINSIQIYSIVKERHDEANNEIEKIFSFLDNSSSFSFSELDDFYNSIALRSAYVFARVDSSISWMNFKDFDYNSISISIDDLKDGCVQKLNEASSLLEYVNYILGFKPFSLNDAYESFYNKEYDVCIYKASLDKAKLNLILSSGGLNEENLNLLFDAKNKSAFDILSVQTHKKYFPVMGYSYYEYAQSLGKNDSSIVNSLLYLEDSIELSGLNVYFKNNNKFFSFVDNKNNFYFLVSFWFFLGLSFGGILFLLFFFIFLESDFYFKEKNSNNNNSNGKNNSKSSKNNRSIKKLKKVKKEH